MAAYILDSSFFDEYGDICGLRWEAPRNRGPRCRRENMPQLIWHALHNVETVFQFLGVA